MSNNAPIPDPANVRLTWTTHVTYELVTGADTVRAALLAAIDNNHPDHAQWTERLNAADGPDAPASEPSA